MQHEQFNNAKLATDIENFGWSVLLVPATEYQPSLAYTVGLWKSFKHPELISFGLNTKTLHLILNDAGEIARSGQTLEIGKIYNEFLNNGKAEFIPVDKRNTGDYFGRAIDFYGPEEFPGLQLVWTDRKGCFPWEQDFEEEFRWRQPLLDRNAEFKFREKKNLAVFTTSQWLELNKPILRVVHDAEGEWQFLTGDQMPGDIRLVGLEQVVLRDKTLNAVFDLDYGEAADRILPGGPWTRQSINTE